LSRWSAICCVAMIALPGLARAQRVGVHGPEERSRPLRAELRGRGYEATGLSDPHALEGLAATVWLEPESPTARVCVFVVRPPRCERIEAESWTILSIRVVESVRAQLAVASPEVAPPPSSSPPSAPLPPPAVEPEPDPTPAERFEWELGVAGAWIVPSGGLDGGASLELSARWIPRDLSGWLVLELGGWTGLVDPAVTGPEGRSSVRSHGGWLAAQLRADLGALRLTGGAGVGLVGARVDAEAGDGFDARPAEAWGAYVAALGAASVRVLDRLALVLSVRVGGVLPAPELRFAGREVGAFGAPLVTLALGVAVAL